MKGPILLVFVLLLVITAVPCVGTAQVQATNFTTVARGSCSPLPYCALPDRGMIFCPGGGEPSNQLMPPWCPSGTHTRARGRELVYSIVQTSDDRVSGTVKIVANINVDSDTLSGNVWGTYHIEVPDRGSWEGTWEGETPGLMKSWSYKVVLVGSGEFDGLKIEATGLWQAGVGDMLTGQIKPRRHHR